MIDYEKFQKSLQHLSAQHENHRVAQTRPELAAIDREAIAESVIQRFEVCYDTLWKTLKRHLAEELGLADAPNSPKPVFRLAGQNRLLPSPVEQWLAYADARTSTAHDYSGKKAQATLALMGDFIADATRLYQTLTGQAPA